jgi:hypothetical protein
MKPPKHHDRDRVRFTPRTRTALLEILKADVGQVLSEDLYSDGEGLERLLRDTDRGAAIFAIKAAIRRAEAEGVQVRDWNYFARDVRRGGSPT